MAQPIPMALPKRDPRQVLQSRLQAAPAEHAEAILAAYEVLQGLHDHGVLEFLRGLLGSSGDVLEIAVDAAQSPQSLRSIRNLLLVINMLGAIDPAQLQALTGTVPKALKAISAQREPPPLWKLATQLLRSKDSRRGLSALNAVLETLGSQLGNKSNSDAEP
ncbi:MAG: hypothetical protein JWN70_6308 [Planctomycetaceae bacterium]|nr:hypothetical protein [Planctomycetaceae bacterium]